MKRLKTFLIYALMIAAFWFLSDFLIYMAVNGTYAHIDAKVLAETPNINISDSKATYVNGYVKGNIFNNSNETITNKYVKIDLYSPRDVLLGTKYVEIQNLDPNTTTNFEMWFKYQDVEYCNITVTDDITNTKEEQFMSDEVKFYTVMGALVILFIM